MSERDEKAFRYAMQFLRESDAEPTDEELERVLGSSLDSTLSEVRHYVKAWSV